MDHNQHPHAIEQRKHGSGDKASGHMGQHGWLILIALIALAFNLRSPLTAIPPVIGHIRADLGLNATLSGLLTSIPVLCFGLLTPLVSMLIAGMGLRFSVCLALGGAAIGLLVRPYSGSMGMFAGTLLIGMALAIGNIASLMIIARDFSRQIHMVTGIYTAALNVGTMLTGVFTAPLAELVGWRFALASWAALAVAAMFLWLWADRHPNSNAHGADPTSDAVAKDSLITHPDEKDNAGTGVLWRRPIVWILSAVFAVHLFIYYAITAWLPSYLIEANGMSATQAGIVASSFQILSLIGALGVPVIARHYSPGVQLIVMGLFWMLTPLWMLIAPAQWPLWSLLGGIAQGGIFVVAFMLIMQHAVDLDDNRRISTAVQGIGYSLASLGPIMVGHLHEINDSWIGGFGALSLLALVLVGSGVAVMRVHLPGQTSA
ncbi:MAG: MFS transporter [Sphingobium sp.]|nr:MFS transporter [Sphingobium sp.]